MRFDEDKFDLTEHRKAASADKREKDRLKRVRRQVKIGKISLAIVSIIIFFALFFVATQLGWMNFS
jgi:hypothetical protein